MGLEQISSLVGNDHMEKSFPEKVSEIVGINDLTQRNDMILQKDGDEGSIDVLAESNDHLEEDLSMMEFGETVLGKERHEKIVRETLAETLKKIGEFIPQDKLNRLFPSIDLSKIDFYDFSRAKFKVFILSLEDYNSVLSVLFPDKDADTSYGYAMGMNSVKKGRNVDKEMTVDLSQKKIILIKEAISNTNIRRRGFNPKLEVDLKNIDENQKNILENDVRGCLAHEIVHSLDVAKDLPRDLMEGITEWYGHQIFNNWYDDSGLAEYVNNSVGYSKITPCVSILFNVALENGIEGSTIDKAFISSDAESKRQILEFFSTRYGEESADKIWNWNFKPSESPLKYIIDLESKKDSKIGEFLNRYGASRY